MKTNVMMINNAEMHEAFLSHIAALKLKGLLYLPPKDFITNMTAMGQYVDLKHPVEKIEEGIPITEYIYGKHLYKYSLPDVYEFLQKHFTCSNGRLWKLKYGYV